MGDHPVEKLLKLTAGSHNVLHWRLDPFSNGLIFSINCSDIFYWGTADSETINLRDDLADIAKAVDDVRRLGVSDYHVAEDGLLLWVARRRQMRPQGAAWTLFHKKIWPMLELAGQYRETTVTNPYEQPSLGQTNEDSAGW